MRRQVSVNNFLYFAKFPAVCICPMSLLGSFPHIAHILELAQEKFAGKEMNDIIGSSFPDLYLDTRFHHVC